MRISKDAEPVVISCDLMRWNITQRSKNLLIRLGDDYFDVLVSYRESKDVFKSEPLVHIHSHDLRNYVGELLKKVEDVTLRIFNATKGGENMFKYRRKEDI